MRPTANGVGTGRQWRVPGAGHASPSSLAASRTTSWSGLSSSTERIRSRRRARSKRVTLIHEASMVDHHRRPVARRCVSKRRQRVALSGRAHARGDARRPQALRGQGLRLVEVQQAGGLAQIERQERQPAPRALEHRRRQRAAPAEGRQRLCHRRHRTLGHVQAAIGRRVVVPRGALVLAGEPQRAARGVVCGRRVDRQHPPDDHAKLPAASTSIASSSSRVLPLRMRSTGRRSRRCGLTPSSQSSAAAGE